MINPYCPELYGQSCSLFGRLTHLRTNLSPPPIVRTGTALALKNTGFGNPERHE